MRSRVTLNSCPMSSSVMGSSMPMPKRRFNISDSLRLKDTSASSTWVLRSSRTAASCGEVVVLSSMKSPSMLSSSSPTGVSRDMGSRDIFWMLFTRSTGILTRFDICSGVASMPVSCTISWEARTMRLMVSTMCTGMRMVRDWSASARVMACLIHQVA